MPRGAETEAPHRNNATLDAVPTASFVVALAATPIGDRLYAVDIETNKVEVLSTPDLTPIDEITVESQPADIVLTPYVAGCIDPREDGAEGQVGPGFYTGLEGPPGR